jgi:septal ring factor EnvC (AmiA/AmiB activator)
MSTPGQPDKTESTMTPTPTNADPMDQNKVSSTILDLTSLPGDLSLASIIAHIKSLENQKNEHLMDIESIKTANTALDGKIKRLEEQLPDAEHELRDKITKREKVEAEIGEAEEVIRGLRASANEFVS